jgi:hypothetical protein
MGVRNYGNDREYIIAWLKRDGFAQLAQSVMRGKLSARFAKELATTTPLEHLDTVTNLAKRWGPRRPEGWRGWEDALSLAAYIDRNQPNKCQVESDQTIKPDNCLCQVIDFVDSRWKSPACREARERRLLPPIVCALPAA